MGFVQEGVIVASAVCGMSVFSVQWSLGSHPPALLARTCGRTGGCDSSIIACDSIDVFVLRLFFF